MPAEQQPAQAPQQGQQCPSGSGTENAAPPAPQPECALDIMKRCQRWLLWREEPGSGAKPNKVPYYANGSHRSGTLDTASDVQQLASYQECKRIFDTGGYTGLAFALGPDGTGNHWQGIDLDTIEQNQLGGIASYAPGYVELSPSRIGVHAIRYGRHFASLGSNRTGVEAYAGKRFFTFTGEVIHDPGLFCIADYVEQKIAPIHGSSHSSDPENAGVTQVDQKTVSELRSALLHMHADDYQHWVNIGLALSCLGGTGRGLWMEWSATSDKFNSAEAAKKWRSFKSNAMSYQTVFHTAQTMGWVNPNSSRTQVQPAVPSSIRISTEEPSIVTIEYLQNPWIPEKTVIGCYGRGEAGKSSWAATMGAQISATHSILWITSEESADHIKIRHRYCGGDGRAIGVINDGAFDIHTHLQDVIGKAKSKFAKPLGVVVLDAVVALVVWKKGESANDDGAVKRLIGYIQSVAESEGVSVLMLGHLNKGKGHEHIADAVLGATAWTTSLRLAYMFQKVPDEDFTGFIRSVKQNMGTNFGSFYETVPVYTMAPNIDGYRPALCGVEFKDERIYGERNLSAAMAEDGDYKAEHLKAKEKRVDHGVRVVLNILKNGTPKTRVDFTVALGAEGLSQRHWLAVERELVRQGVEITTGERNKKYYQLCAAALPKTLT